MSLEVKVKKIAKKAMTSLAPMGGTALSHKNIFHSSFGPFEIVEVKKRKEKNGGSLVVSFICRPLKITF